MSDVDHTTSGKVMWYEFRMQLAISATSEDEAWSRLIAYMREAPKHGIRTLPGPPEVSA